MSPRHLRHLGSVLPLAVILACGTSTPPVVTPAPQRATATKATTLVRLRNDWRAIVTLQRADSLILTLPNGSRQLQRFGRAARFTVEVSANNAFTATLDSLSVQPAAGDAVADVLGTRWTGKVSGAGRIEGLRISRSTPLGDDMTSTVRALLPPVPFAGVPIGKNWKDTLSGSNQVEVFRTNETRTRSWTSGEATERNGVAVHPIRVREEFEQVGKGSQAGQEMTMTAQGSRVGNYYMTLDGRVEGAALQDSIAQFITIPSARQTIPTMRFSRTTIRYSTSLRGDRP